MPSRFSSSVRSPSSATRSSGTDVAAAPRKVHPQSGRCRPQPGERVSVRVQRIADALRERPELRDLPSGPRVCGRLRCSETVGLNVSTDGESRRAYLDGVVRCGSPSACISCGFWLRYEQRQELEALAAWWSAQGGTLALLTLTIRHWEALALDKSVKGVLKAWREMTRPKGWRKLCSRLGVAHALRALDATHGEAGWHVHLHVLVLIRPGVTPSPDAVDEVFARWSKRVGKALGSACVPARDGLDWRTVESAMYVAEMDVGEPAPEATSRSPWQIAAEAGVGHAGDIALWKEWVIATKGVPLLPPARQLAPVVAEIRAERQQVVAARRARERLDTHDQEAVAPTTDPNGAAAASNALRAASSSPGQRHDEVRQITRELVASFPGYIWDRLVWQRGAVADLQRRALHGGLPDVAVGTARYVFGNAEGGAPDPNAVAWVLRVITPKGRLSTEPSASVAANLTP